MTMDLVVSRQLSSAVSLFVDRADAIASSSSRARSDSVSGGRQREPPIVFSLTLPHIFHLIFSLPNPAPPPEAYAGGTPNPTPPVTPGLESTSPFLHRSPLSPVGEAQARSLRTRRDTVSSVEEDEATRTMPGDYRRTSRDRDSSD